MPNRYIRASAIESPAVNSLSWFGEVFYRRLLNRVDDFGRFTANHSLLRASIFPLQLDRAREADIPRLLAECEKAGLVFVYAAGGKQCLIINKWEQGRAKHSEYPEPPANICERMQTYVYGCSHMSPTPTPTPTNDTDTDTDSAAGAALPGIADSGLPFASAEFAAAWSEWGRHLTEKRKPLKDTARRAQLKKLAAMGEARAIAALAHSTSNNWTGIFEPNNQTTAANGQHRTGFDHRNIATHSDREQLRTFSH